MKDNLQSVEFENSKGALPDTGAGSNEVSVYIQYFFSCLPVLSTVITGNGDISMVVYRVGGSSE